MKVLVLFAHPNPSSFNGSILPAVKEELASRGLEVRVRDLYAANWNPALSAAEMSYLGAGQVVAEVAREQAEVAWANVVLLISPIWLWSVTAMMKGYIDRVMSQGFAYTFDEQGIKGLLTGKRAIIIATSGADEKTALADGMIETFGAFFNAIFLTCGFTKVSHKTAMPWIPSYKN